MHAHASVIGNCILCISGEDGLLGLTLIFVTTGWMGTALFCLANRFPHFCIEIFPALWSSNFTKITVGFWLSWLTIIFATLPIWPFISLSAISMLVVSITLAPSLMWISKSSPPVSDLPLHNNLSISCFVTLGGYWSTAVSTNKGFEIWSSCLLLCSETGLFSAQMWSASEG